MHPIPRHCSAKPLLAIYVQPIHIMNYTQMTAAKSHSYSLTKVKGNILHPAVQGRKGLYPQSQKMNHSSLIQDTFILKSKPVKSKLKCKQGNMGKVNASS